MSESDRAAEPDERAETETDHLDDVPDGFGCVEAWEHTAEGREREAGD